MVELKVLVAFNSLDDKQNKYVGDIITVSEQRAETLINKGLCEVYVKETDKSKKGK